MSRYLCFDRFSFPTLDFQLYFAEEVLIEFRDGSGVKIGPRQLPVTLCYRLQVFLWFFVGKLIHCIGYWWFNCRSKKVLLRAWKWGVPPIMQSFLEEEEATPILNRGGTPVLSGVPPSCLEGGGRYSCLFLSKRKLLSRPGYHCPVHGGGGVVMWASGGYNSTWPLRDYSKTVSESSSTLVCGGHLLSLLWCTTSWLFHDNQLLSGASFLHLSFCNSCFTKVKT